MGSRRDLLEKTLRTPQKCHLSIEATTGTIKCELIPLITTRKSESWELAATSTFTIAASQHQGTWDMALEIKISIANGKNKAKSNTNTTGVHVSKSVQMHLSGGS